MREISFCERHKEFVEQLHKHSDIFGYSFIPNREVLIDDKKRQSCFELLKKSCEENHDYVAEEYNIDVEHRKKHYDVIYD